MPRFLSSLILVSSFLVSFGAPQISLLTFYPGQEIYELEGHTALRVQDENMDYTMNWGTFDFNSPNFVYRFVKGETDYMLEADYSDLFINHYRRDGRRVVEQKLNLTDEEAERVFLLIRQNLQPENLHYRYKYVHDNCATRPLKVLESALNDSLYLAEADNAETTFRQVMRRYHRNYPWYQFGIDIALGSDLDLTMTNREHTFVPVQLEQMVAGATIGKDGRKLVASTEVLVEGSDVVLPPTPWYLTPMFFATLIALIVIAVSVRDIRRGKPSRWLDACFYAILSVAGLILTFLIFISVHEATSPNFNYLWMNPLCLLGIVLPWLRKAARLLVWWQFINFALILTYATSVVCGIQSANIAFWPILVADAVRSLVDIYLYRRYVKS